MSSRDYRSDLVDIEAVVRVERDLSWGVVDPNDEAAPLIWLPKSQCEVEWIDRVRKTATVTMPEWLATEKGLT